MENKQQSSFVPPEALAKLEDSIQDQIIAASITQHSFSGPLPPPEILEHYEKIFPGAAKKIFELTELQSKHRMQIESKVIDSGSFESKLGIMFGFFIAIAVIAASAWFVAKGQTLAGVIGLVSTISALVYSFRYDATESRGDLERKNKELADAEKAKSR